MRTVQIYTSILTAGDIIKNNREMQLHNPDVTAMNLQITCNI